MHFHDWEKVPRQADVLYILLSDRNSNCRPWCFEAPGSSDGRNISHIHTYNEVKDMRFPPVSRELLSSSVFGRSRLLVWIVSLGHDQTISYTSSGEVEASCTRYAWLSYGKTSKVRSKCCNRKNGYHPVWLLGSRQRECPFLRQSDNWTEQ